MTERAPIHSPLYDMRALGFAAGEVVVVTGAGSGIGRATALAAATSGLGVAVWDINRETALETARAAEALGVPSLAITLDVSDPAAVAEAWKQSVALGACRYLVNNAGPPSRASGLFLDNLAVALGSVECVTRLWLEHCANDAVSVVNLASIAGNFQGGGQTLAAFYPTAKTGIVGYTRWLATRYGGRPRANAVAPGIALTARTIPYLDNPAIEQTVARIPLGRPGSAEEIASAILFLLSPAASYVNGVILPVDGGWAHS